MTTKEAIRHLAPKIKERTLVPFCGAGISVPSNLPTAKEFLNLNNFNETDFNIATYILNNTDGFRQLFHRTYGNRDIIHNILHELIAQLNPKYCITTNYDRLLESAFKKRFGNDPLNKFGVIMREGDLPTVNSCENILVKLHGDIIVQDLLVFTKAHYIERLHSQNLVDSFIHYLFATNTILFIGYSLSDENIFSLLDKEKRLIAPDLPEKYIVLHERNNERERFLNSLNVKPIYLECNVDNIQSSLASFLYQLWEQLDYYSTLATMLEVTKKSSLKETVERAISLRRENETEKAKVILDELFKSPAKSWEHQLPDLPKILWLFVSIYDKLEKWDELVLIENLRINSLFNTLKETLPNDIYNTLYCSYQGNVAMAMLRSMNFDEAFGRLNESSSYQPTESSPESLIIHKANINTIWAIAYYMLFIKSNCTDSNMLNEANKKLNEAESLFRKCKDDCHHKGRFNGIYALLGTINSSDNLTTIFEKADLSYNGRNNGENRTKYGKIAGRYCDAYCHYWAATIESDNDHANDYLIKAKTLLEICEDDLMDSQFIAKTKIYGLMVNILNRLNNGDVNNYKQKFENAYNKLDDNYRLKIENFGFENWLKTPLN